MPRYMTSLSLAVWFDGCSQYKMHQHGSSLEQVEVTTSLQCWGSNTGCRWDRETTSNWQHWRTSLYTSRTNVNLSRRWDAGISGHRTATRVQCHGQSEIGDRSFMTAGLRPWNNLPVELQPQNITFEYFKGLLNTSVFN